MYNIQIEKNIITITFDYLIDLMFIINILNFFFSKDDFYINKITLVKKQHNILWYFDLTEYKQNSLIALSLKLKTYFIDKSRPSTHISSSEDNNLIKIVIESLDVFDGNIILLKEEDLKNLMIQELLLILK